MTTPDDKNAAFIGSIGIIRRFVDENEQWLMIRDDFENTYRLIQADREENETFRDCLHKNLETELGLNPKKDYIISGLSMAHHQAPIEWPGEERPQWVIVQFFPIQLYGQSARDKITQHSTAEWISLADIAIDKSPNGYQFDLKQRELINRADLIPPHLNTNI